VVCSLAYGGSLIRPEATGYGLVYFADEVLQDAGDSFKVRSPIPAPLLAPEKLSYIFGGVCTHLRTTLHVSCKCMLLVLTKECVTLPALAQFPDS
jgi:hypothetical protein